MQAYQVFSSGGVVGNKALKSLYVGYTDASFTEKTAQPSVYGYLGPLIKAQARTLDTSDRHFCLC